MTAKLCDHMRIVLCYSCSLLYCGITTFNYYSTKNTKDNNHYSKQNGIFFSSCFLPLIQIMVISIPSECSWYGPIDIFYSGGHILPTPPPQGPFIRLHFYTTCKTKKTNCSTHRDRQRASDPGQSIDNNIEPCSILESMAVRTYTYIYIR